MIWSYLLKKPLMENFIFYAAFEVVWAKKDPESRFFIIC